MTHSGKSRRVAASAVTALAIGGVLVTGSAQAIARPAAVPGSVVQVPGKHGCYTEDGSGSAGAGKCTNIRGGHDATTVTVSPDGRSAYEVGYGDPAVLSVFSRDTNTGVLTQLGGKAGCLSRNGASEDGPHTCTRVRDLDTGDARSITLSKDGRFVYVASQFATKSSDDLGGVAVFSRNPKTGVLRQLAGKAGCVTSDGSSNEGAGTCAAGREVDDISNVHLSPDQKFLYASNYDGQPYSGIAIFKRDPKTGKLTQLSGKEGCITSSGDTEQSKTTAICRAMPNIGNPWDVATAGNKFLYIPDEADGLVQAFRRDVKGGLKPLTGTGACVSDTGNSPLGMSTCVLGRGLHDVERAVLSANQRYLYTNAYRDPAPIAVLRIDPSTGLLSERNSTSACYSRDGTTGDSALSCRDGRDLSGGYAGVLSPDGKTLYYAEFGNGAPDAGLVIFHVNEATGGFTQLAGKLGCVSPDGSSDEGAGTCQVGAAITGAYQVGISRGGGGVYDLYVAADRSNGIDFFRATP
jgi:WD40 repeat protein